MLGLTCEFSTNRSPFTPQPDLRLIGVLKNNKEMPFFIRLKSELGSTPDANGSFDIIVRADKFYFHIGTYASAKQYFQKMKDLKNSLGWLRYKSIN
ncbi:hypothetical protein [Lysinibacillus sp. NPDC093692]|uniref:hypothetical protein n=1 Tax=Lysinibacillus sp. NPDC093692 TaxID=3390578 RepID=UPI003CFC1CDB